MEIPVRVDVSDPARLVVTWEDGSVTALDAIRLRESCPCASCRDRPSAPEGTEIRGVDAVGGYAISVTFGPDGHATGIFTYRLLRELGEERPG